jgi:hypothetical protein
MGTSKSSKGPASGVPLVPPWVPDPVPPADDGQPPPVDGSDDDAQDSENSPQQPDTATRQPLELAPPARFGGARTNLGSYASTGSSQEMRRGIGQYINKGLGGAHSATQRMGATARTAGALYGALSSVGSGGTGAAVDGFDPANFAGASADEIMDALVEAVRPIDGTLDAEAGRDAVKNALSELLTEFPEADLLNLAEAERLFAIEQYISLDVYNRFRLDLGQTIKEKATSTSVALARLKEVRDYIKETVSSQFRALRKAGEQLASRKVASMARQALQDAFEVFEGYAH